MSTNPTGAGTWAARTTRTTLALAGWTVGWVASLALAAFGPGSIWHDAPVLTVAAIVLSVLVGIGMLLAHRRQLAATDELQRATQLQAMAWALGAGLVGGTALTLLDRHGVIGLEVGVGHLIILMAVVYLIGSVAGSLRYR